MSRCFLRILIAISLATLCLPAFGGTWSYLGAPRTYQDIEFSEEKVTKFVQELRKLDRLPEWPTEVWEKSLLAVDTQEPLDPLIKRQFAAIQHFLLGRNNHITLSTCADDCAAQSERTTKKIYISLEFIKKIRAQQSASDANATIAAILAHELSHFVVWYSLELHKKTIHGFGNDLTLRYYLSSTPEEMVPVAIDAAHEHYEIDFIALVAMKNLGMAYPEKFAEFMRKENREIHASEFDPLTQVLIDAEHDIRFAKVSEANFLFSK